MSFSEGRDGLFNGSWPLDESTNRSDNNACHHIPYLCSWRIWTVESQSVCVLLGHDGYYMVLSHFISMFPCLTALLLKSQRLCTLNLPMFGGSSDWINCIPKNNSISVAELSNGCHPKVLQKVPLMGQLRYVLGILQRMIHALADGSYEVSHKKIGTTDHKTTRKLLEPSNTRESRRQKNTCWIWP